MLCLEESVRLLSSVEVSVYAGGEPAVGCAWGRQGRAKYDMVSWCMVGLMCACRDTAPRPPSYDLLHV